jgi:hypothetical protein
LAGKRRCYRGRGERQRRRNFGGKTEGKTEEEARDKEGGILAEKQKVKQKKRRETKNKFERENEGVTEEEARDSERNSLGGNRGCLKGR